MAAERLSLLGGAYRARSLIANAQRCVNLVPEKNPESSQSPAPYTFNPRPGYSLLLQAPALGVGRGIYTATDGKLYMVVGTNVYYVNNNWQATLIGTIALGRSIVSMADNGTNVLMVDGTTAGYSILMATTVMSPIIDPAFYGGDRVEYVGSCFMLNRIGTPQAYISGPNTLTWDPLDFLQKTSSPDPVVIVFALNNQAWVIGTRKGEVWYFSGAADFPFQQLPGVQIEHGIAAKYGVAVTDKYGFWLTQDKDGKPWVAQGSADYSVVRVSTHAIEYAIQNYARWDDAIGYVLQQEGHTYAVFNFPAADKTWVYDLSTKLWHERASIDMNGALHRDRGQMHAYAYNTNVVQDWQTGDLLKSDPNLFDDKGIVFPCIRTFPHSVAAMQNISYRCLTADMEVGERGAAIPSPWSSGFSTGFGPLPDDSAPKVFLRQSIDRGKSFRSARARNIGKVGEYKKIPRWWRLDLARDCVFELSWAVNAKTSLNGVFLDPSDMAET